MAVQSHWFSVGPIVPWARAGVGAVATQANVEMAYGPRGLELMGSGLGARGALERLVAEDSLAASRQVAMVDAAGATAAHTGAECIPYAGHATGAGVSCQANIMSSEAVWPAMLSAYEAAQGPLADRLLAALEAGEAAGGDVRGRQSAALLVVPARGEAWETSVSLRVEDHPEPLTELRRLLALDAAYKLAGQADWLVAAGDHQRAAELYVEAAELVPASDELQFWAGLGAAGAGRLEEALARVRAAIAVNPGWRELLDRLPAEVAPSARAVAEALGPESPAHSSRRGVVTGAGRPADSSRPGVVTGAARRGDSSRPGVVTPRPGPIEPT